MIKLSEANRANEILDLLEDEYPEVVGTALEYESPHQLLISTILSAQCTDKRVNKVTKRLFNKYPTLESISNASLKGLEKIIKSTGFYHNKAKYIKQVAEILINEYNSELPREISELTKLPGVGRKTANVVLSNAFGINQGIAVDTHVKRLSKRLEFTENENPDKIEKDLMDLFSRDRWPEINSLLITHGRRICTARNPVCGECVLSDYCPSAFSFD